MRTLSLGGNSGSDSRGEFATACTLVFDSTTSHRSHDERAVEKTPFACPDSL